MSEQPGRYQRSFSGMIGAMVILVLVVVGFVVFRDLNRNDPPSPVQRVDFLTPAKYARTAADFPLLAPHELPDGWIATSVSFTPGKKQAWHLGCLTGERRYVGLEQSHQAIPAMVEQYVDPDASQGGDVTTAGHTWQSWTDSGGDLALVRRGDDVTTLVVGRVPQATLETFIATLH